MWTPDSSWVSFIPSFLSSLCTLHNPSSALVLGLLFLLAISTCLLASCCFLCGCISGIAIYNLGIEKSSGQTLVGAAVEAGRLAYPLARTAAARLAGYSHRPRIVE